MANGFPTGVSATPIDITSGARAFSRAALESRLQEIASSREEISENEKKVLKALSITAPTELLKGQRQRYQDEIEAYRQSVIDKFKQSGGKLTTKDQTEIQDGFLDMQNRMQNEVNQVEQFRKMQEDILSNPNSQYLYDMGRVPEIFGDAYSRLEKGEGLGDISARLGSAMLAPSTGDYLFKRYGNEIDRLDIASKGDWIDANTFEFTTAEDEAEVDRRIDDIMRDPNYRRQYILPDGSVDEQAYEGLRADLKDLAIRSQKEIKTYKPSSRTGSGSAASAQQLYPTEIETSRGEETWYNYPSGVPQTKRTIDVKSAYDVDTGEKVDINDRMDYSVVSFNPNNRRVRIQTTGGEVTSNGKPMLYDPSSKSIEEGMSLTEKRKAGRAQGEWKKDTRAKAALFRQSSSFENVNDVDEVKNVKLTENEDGTYTLSGELVRYDRNLLGRKKKDIETSEKVETTLQPIRDKSVDRTLELDIDEYRGVLSPLETKWKIGNRMVKDVLNNPEQKEKNEVARATKDGRIAIFDADTKEFIRWQ